MAPPRLSVLIPVRQEASRLPLLLADLGAAGSLVHEVLVVDGGSVDGTPDLVRLAGARLLASEPGRGQQLRHGARHCDGDWLLVLHADGRLLPGWQISVGRAMQSPVPRVWCFPLRVVADLGGPLTSGPLFGLLGLLVGLRSRGLQRPYGDQGLLLPLSLYRAVGGFRPLPLMEDLDLVERLARRSRFGILEAALRVDGRRWLGLGLWRTTWLNAGLRRAWRRGVPARVLARYYRAPWAFRMRTRRRSGGRWVPAPSLGCCKTAPRRDRRTG